MGRHNGPMRLVATEYLSLDGVFEEPGQWSRPWFNEEAAQFKFDELKATAALLLGRRTYDGFAAAWPTMEGTGEFGERMNSIPKYVVSSTLQSPHWTGAQVLRGDTATEVRRLKEMPGGDLLMAGSGQLFDTLMSAGLIDLYRFMIHPVVLGRGRKLFDTELDQVPLELVSTLALKSGIVIVEYRPAAAD